MFCSSWPNQYVLFRVVKSIKKIIYTKISFNKILSTWNKLVQNCSYFLIRSGMYSDLYQPNWEWGERIVNRRIRFTSIIVKKSYSNLDPDSIFCDFVTRISFNWEFDCDFHSLCVNEPIYGLTCNFIVNAVSLFRNILFKFTIVG